MTVDAKNVHKVGLCKAGGDNVMDFNDPLFEGKRYTENAVGQNNVKLLGKELTHYAVIFNYNYFFFYLGN